MNEVAKETEEAAEEAEPETKEKELEPEDKEEKLAVEPVSVNYRCTVAAKVDVYLVSAKKLLST